jgi:hypothetical protein
VLYDPETDEAENARLQAGQPVTKQSGDSEGDFTITASLSRRAGESPVLLTGEEAKMARMLLQMGQRLIGVLYRDICNCSESQAFLSLVPGTEEALRAAIRRAGITD